jgi:hypothetical protein
MNADDGAEEEAYSQKARYVTSNVVTKMKLNAMRSDLVCDACNLHENYRSGTFKSQQTDELCSLPEA